MSDRPTREQYEAMFEEQKEKLASMKLKDVVAAQAAARSEQDAKKAEAAYATNLYDYISIYVLPEKMEDEGMEGTKVAGIGRVNLRPDIWCSTAKGMGPELIAWLKDNDHEDLAKETVNPSTLKAFVKEQRGKADGIKIPDDLVSVTPYTRAVITKS